MTTFLLSCLAFSLSPGPGALCTIQKTLTGSRRAAFAAVAGLQAALALHLAIVAVGLGSLYAAWPSLQRLSGALGALWLLVLAWQRWRAGSQVPEEVPGRNSWREFLDGFLVNLGNPKSILFLAALLPSFVDPHSPPLPQFARLGAALIAIDLAVMGAYIAAAARLSPLLRQDSTRRRLDRLFAAIFAALALGLACRSLA